MKILDVVEQLVNIASQYGNIQMRICVRRNGEDIRIQQITCNSIETDKVTCEIIFDFDE